MSTAILDITKQYSAYTGYAIVLFGILGNILNLIVFTQLKIFRNNRSAFYIIIESISNFMYMGFYFSSVTLTVIYGDDATARSQIWCKFRNILVPILVLTTYYTICFAAMDQYFSTNYRMYQKQICTMKLARCLVFACLCVFMIHSIAFGLSYNISPSAGCVMSNPIWLRYATFFYYSIFTGVLPIVLSGLFSIMAYRNVRRIVRRQIPIVRRQLDQQMTALVLMRVIAFVCSELPSTIYRIYIINNPISQSKQMEYAIGRLIQTIFLSFVSLIYTLNFYIFYISSQRFRRQVKYVLVKKIWRECISCQYFNKNQVSPQETISNGINMDIVEDI